MSGDASKVDLTSLKINRNPVPQNSDEEKNNSKLWIGLGVTLALLLGGYFFMPSLGSGKVVSLTTVQLVFASQGTGVLTASGYIVPQRKASVASKATGRLVFRGVEEGDVVKKGQILARIESADLEALVQQAEAGLVVGRAQVELAEADVEKAKADYDRNETFLKSGVITNSDFELVRSLYKSAIARLNSAKANIAAIDANIRNANVQVENTIIRAPFDGTILTKNADIGEIVAPFASGANSRGNVVTMADMSSLQLEADVSETNIERIKLGQPCEIALDAAPDKRYRGEVWKIVPTADRAKATILTKIRFLEIDKKVLPEMSAKVTFLSQAISDSAMKAKPKMTVPASALVERNGRKVLFMVKNDIVQEVAPLVGETLGDRIEIVSGVQAGDRIVAKPAEDLQKGDKIAMETK